MIRRLGTVLCACALATCVLAFGASAASATTFFVNGSTGNDGHACKSPAEACKTIKGGLTRVEEDTAEEPPHLEIAAGTYKENVGLEDVALAGLTINGAGSGTGGTTLEATAKTAEAALGLDMFNAAVTVSNMHIVTAGEDTGPALSGSGNLTLNNIVVNVQTPTSSAPGIEVEELGSLTMNGGGATMAKETKGAAIVSEFVPTTLNGTTVKMESGSAGAGLELEDTPATVTGVTVTAEPGSTGGEVELEGATGTVTNSTINFQAATKSSALVFAEDSATVTNVVVNYAGEETAVQFELSSPMSVDGLKVAMSNSKDKAPAIVGTFGSGTLAHTEISGAWEGPALIAQGGSTTLADSRLTTNSTNEPTLEVAGTGVGSTMLVQRSVISAPPKSTDAAVIAAAANLTIDSSEVLGGDGGVLDEQEVGKTRTITIDGSTIDAGEAGVADAPPVYDVRAIAVVPTSTAAVNVIGSVLFEQQLSEVPAGSKATVRCEQTNAPSQTQAASGTTGSIACGAGENGNTAAPPAALFSAPITNYTPAAGSVAINSVLSSTITLPFGFTPSSSDLLGNPRSEGVACTTVQDRGAIQVPGHGMPCPSGSSMPAPVAKPLAGVITALTINPSSFAAAPSGATISAKHKAKKKFGALVSYHDSQAASTTFAVIRKVSGRKQGKSCKKPSSSNRHGKRCTLLVKIGAFTHTDKAGANSFHFSGRIKGAKLAPGSYELSATAHDAAGNGPTVTRTFTIT